MLAASLTLLTPYGGFLALLAVLPLLALAAGGRRVVRARAVLRLQAPERRRAAGRAAALAAVPLLLAVAAMQPALRTRSTLRVRTDAATWVVLDTSRSMGAAASPAAPTRLDRAKRIAIAAAAALPDVPVGIATLTDRTLPDLFPTPDRAAFDSTVQSLQLEDPPPAETNRIATSFSALSSLATGGFFDRTPHRAVLLVTDGESRPFDASAVTSALGRGRIVLALVRVGGGGERVWKPDGSPETAYRADPGEARAATAQLAGGNVFGSADPAAAVLRRALGRGPTRAVGRGGGVRSLAPAVALLALVPVAVLLRGPRGRLRTLRGVTFARRGASGRRRAA
jgi:hypothetical protein